MIINNQIIDQSMFCAVKKTYLLILANLQSNKRQRKERLRFSHQHFPYKHLSERGIFHSYKTLKKCSHFLASLINHLE